MRSLHSFRAVQHLPHDSTTATVEVGIKDGS